MRLDGITGAACRTVLALAATLLALGGTARAQVTVAGDLLIDVDVTAAGVGPGTLTEPLANLGTLGGGFTPYNSPEIIAFPTATGTKNVLAQSGAVHLVLQDGGVDVPAPDEMTGNDSWTVEAWLQVETFAGDCQWFGWAPTVFNVHAAALLYATAGGYPAAWFSDAVGGYWLANWGTLNPNPVATDQAWHHVVYTWDGVSTFRTYMDGVPSITEVNATGLGIQAAQKIMLGRCYGDDGNPAYSPPNTRIAKVRVHSDVLDETGVLANYEAEKADFSPAPAPKIAVETPLASLVVFGSQGSQAGPTAKAAVTIRNGGFVELPAGFTVSLAGANPGDFTLDAPDTSAVAVDASRSFQVAFDPVADDEPKTASLTIDWPAGPAWSAGSVSVRLFGNNRIVHIDPTGGDDAAGLGTEESPWQTLAKALASTGQGDAIVLFPGVYPCDDGGAWNGRVRQLRSTDGPDLTTIQAGDHWFNGFGSEPTVLSCEGIKFTPRAAGSGTCFLHNGGDAVFSLTLKDCVFEGDWGWNNTVGMVSVKRSELLAESTVWTTPDTGIENVGDASGKVVRIADSAFEGCLRAINFNGRKSRLEVADTSIVNGQDAGISGILTDSAVDLRGVDITNITVGAGFTFEVREASTVAIRGSSATECGMAGAFFRPVINGTDNVPSVTIADSVFVDNCRNTADNFAAQANVTFNGWDDTKKVPAGSAMVDRCWIGTTAHQAQLPLKTGLTIEDLDSAIVRNTVIEGGYRGIAIVTADPRTKRVESCTLIGTEEASEDDVSPGSTVAITHKDIDGGYGDGQNAPVVTNCIVYGFDALDGGTPWDAESADNLAFAEGEAGAIDPKLAFQGGAPFLRPAAVSPIGDLADYRPAAGSPAIDAGDCATAPAQDYDGSPRPRGAGCDIGAYEAEGSTSPRFNRGDANADGDINITDGIFILNYLFLGGATPPCLEAANVNDDAEINITDGIYVLNYLFLGGGAPADPTLPDSACGVDPPGSPTALGCDSFPAC